MADLNFPMEAFLQANQQKDINDMATNPPLGSLLAQGITKGVTTIADQRQKEKEAAKATMLEFVKNEIKDKDFVDVNGKPYDMNVKLQAFQEYAKGNYALRQNPDTGDIELATKKGDRIGMFKAKQEDLKFTVVTPTPQDIDALKKLFPGYPLEIGKDIKIPTTTYNAMAKQQNKPIETPEEKEARIFRERKSAAKGTVEGSKGGGTVDKTMFEQENKLRDDYRKDIGEYPKIRDSYTRILQSAKEPSAAGDLALIFNYMKILDPGSVVREGEFATAQNSGSVPDIIIAKYNKVKSGERLSPSIRADFVDRASKLYQGQEAQYKKVTNDYTNRAKSYGLDPNRIMTDYSIAESQNIPQVPQAPQTPQSVLPTDKAARLEELRRKKAQGLLK